MRQVTLLIILFKYFGLAAAGVGSQPRYLELPDGATVDTLAEHLCQTTDGINRELMNKALIMVNHRHAGRDSPLHDGDEVMALHVMGGG